ncbi:MAG: sensor domain-containing protein [Trebonia sp.]|jgi:signal transduction histidine kinase
MYLVRDLVSARTWLALIHHLAGLLVGFVVIFIVVFGLGFGIATAPLALVGLPLIGITLRFTDWLGRFERGRFAVLLGAAIPAWPQDTRAGYHWVLIPSWRKLGARATWSEVGYALVRLPVSVVTAAVSFSVAAASLVMLSLPLYNWALPRGGAVVGGTVLRGGPVLTASAVGGLLLLLAAAQLARGLAVADAAVSRRLLGPPSRLAARVTELERSRERVVDAAEAERRRIERDLHDGAQQRLVALAMELGRAKAKFGDDPAGARELVDQAHAQAKEALTELRNLVRGVHPPVLTDRGLDAALSGLAAICPIPVEMQVDVAVRPKPAVEAVAYFVVAEALTNVAKHSRASQVRVMVEGHGFPGSLTVLISDDGIGGANPRGAGLSGLADRVGGVDGELSVESPAGGPTIISAVLPCG